MIHAIHMSGLSVAIRESQLIYPLLQVAHIVGISLFAGGTIFANLRVAGVGRNVPLVDFIRYTTRISTLGLALVVTAGALMFAAFADVFFVSTVMRIKLLILLLALANLSILRRRVSGPEPIWRTTPPDPVAARKWCAIGITVFLALVTLGKLLAYIGGKD